MQSPEETLSFYFDLLFTTGISQVKNSFAGNHILRKNGYSYLQEYDYFMKEEMIEDDNVMPIFITDIIERSDFFGRLLTFENTSIYNTIESEISTSSEDENKELYLKGIYDDVQLLVKRTLNLEDEEKSIVEIKLIELIKNLKDRYSSIIQYHNVFKFLIKESDVTFFKNKDLKYSFYQGLYELAYTLYLIDDTEIEEVDFIEAFTSSKPCKSSSKSGQ